MNHTSMQRQRGDERDGHKDTAPSETQTAMPLAIRVLEAIATMAIALNRHSVHTASNAPLDCQVRGILAMEQRRLSPSGPSPRNSQRGLLHGAPTGHTCRKVHGKHPKSAAGIQHRGAVHWHHEVEASGGKSGQCMASKG